MKKIYFAIILALVFAFIARPVFAVSPRLFFNTPQMGVKQGDEFDAVIKIDTSGQSSTGADAVINYNSEMFEVESIENGGFFPLFGKHYELSTQKIFITGFFTDKNQSKNGTGSFAKLTLKALKNGVSTLQFACINKSLSDTNVINLKGDDMIVCSDLIPLQVTVSGGNFAVVASSFGKILGTDSGNLVATPTLFPTEIPTLIPSPSVPVSTTSALMDTGVFDNAALMILMGGVFIITGGFLLVYSRKETLI
jgi:hypothetical protein